MSSDLVERCAGHQGDWEWFRYKKDIKFNRLFLSIGWMDLSIARDTLSRKHMLHIFLSFPSRSSEEFATRNLELSSGYATGLYVLEVMTNCEALVSSSLLENWSIATSI